jgi:hypothetical protein
MPDEMPDGPGAAPTSTRFRTRRHRQCTHVSIESLQAGRPERTEVRQFRPSKVLAAGRLVASLFGRGCARCPKHVQKRAQERHLSSRFPPASRLDTIRRSLGVGKARPGGQAPARRPASGGKSARSVGASARRVCARPIHIRAPGGASSFDPRVHAALPGTRPCRAGSAAARTRK